MATDRLSLKDRVAVVIGGTSGIGHTLALGLAKAGAQVVASSRRQAEVDHTALELQALGVKPVALACDVLERRSLVDLRARLREPQRERVADAGGPADHHRDAPREAQLFVGHDGGDGSPRVADLSSGQAA